MSFANPYNFVAINEEKIPREKDLVTHEKFSRHSGKLVCNIRFISNFITAGTNNKREKKQLLINRKACIQASSLKGMLRATAEAISNSCISLMSRSHEGLVNENALINSCNVDNGLCICCRLFGTTAKEDKTNEESFSFRGKIRLSDAEYIGYYDEGNVKTGADPFSIKYLKNHLLSSPKPQHESFYLNGTKIKGRKFYYHQKSDKLLDSSERDTAKVTLIKEGAVFQFTLTFENLTEEEYALLLWTIELEPGLGHRIGMGKPIGLGSCEIEITELKEISEKRYHSIAEKDKWIIYGNENLGNRINDIKGWWSTGIPDDLQCILKLDNGFTEIRYPDHNKNEFQKYKELHLPCVEFP